MAIRMRGAAAASVLLAKILAALPSSATAVDGTMQLNRQLSAIGLRQTQGITQGTKTITFETGDTYTKKTFVVDDNSPHHDDPADAGNSCGDSCVDKADFVSRMGFSCRGHTDFDCALFDQVGFTEEEVEELIANCPCSCQACPTVARTHTQSFSPIKTPSSSSTTAPVSSRPTSPPKAIEPDVEKDDMQDAVATDRSFWNTRISSSNKASVVFTPLIFVLAVVFAAAMFRLGQTLFRKRSATNSGPGMAVFSVSRKRRRAKVKDAKGAPEAEIQNTSTYYSSTTKTSTQVANDEESSWPSIDVMTVTEDDTITEHYKERKDKLYNDMDNILCNDKEDMLCC